jgi:hypothetical protein
MNPADAVLFDSVLRYHVQIDRLSHGTQRLISADIEAAIGHVDRELRRRLAADAPATYARLQGLRSELVSLRAALRDQGSRRHQKRHHGRC